MCEFKLVSLATGLKESTWQFPGEWQVLHLDSENKEMPWILSVLNFVFVKIKTVLQNLTVAFSVHFIPKLLLIVTV